MTTGAPDSFGRSFHARESEDRQQWLGHLSDDAHTGRGMVLLQSDGFYHDEDQKEHGEELHLVEDRSVCRALSRSVRPNALFPCQRRNCVACSYALPLGLNERDTEYEVTDPWLLVEDHRRDEQYIPAIP